MKKHHYIYLKYIHHLFFPEANLLSVNRTYLLIIGSNLFNVNFLAACLNNF